jgi:hypothetical protein
MQIAGRWEYCPDGAIRPMVVVEILKGDGSLWSELFLIDSGADAAVLNFGLLPRLNLPAQPPMQGHALVGLTGSTGSAGFVMVSTALEFAKTDGGKIRVYGQFAAFTQATSNAYVVRQKIEKRGDQTATARFVIRKWDKSFESLALEVT